MVSAASELPVKSAIIDGEMTVLNDEGRSDYHAFRKAIKGSPGQLVFIAFDLLMLDGKDQRAQTTVDRRLVPGAGGREKAVHPPFILATL